ncbi:MAG: GGDEF domain-containing protein [Pirellulaceae bacterium]|nr:GGDEF domain-containing protein [Pirellulaceae bacterium]
MIDPETRVARYFIAIERHIMNRYLNSHFSAKYILLRIVAASCIVCIGVGMVYLLPPYSTGFVNGGSIGLILGFLVSEKWRRDAETEKTKLLEVATTDPLTRLGNRRLMESELFRRLAIHRRYGTPFSVLLIDVDHFKSINDNHGHDIGDRVLQALARTIPATLRDVDLLFRMGGEEFLAVLPDAPLNNAVIAANRIQESINGMVVASNDRLLSITVSQGLAEVQCHEEVESLLKRADQALYAAKRNGRNTFFMDLGQPDLDPVPGNIAALNDTEHRPSRNDSNAAQTLVSK